jgi:GNAT superfamily N-acetyltransferase
VSVLISVEPYDSVIDDIRPLLPEHWKELALWTDEIELDPDFEAYRRACDAGVMRIYTVRLGGMLIGYAIFAVIPRHMHYRHRWAINDIIWVHPDHRSFGIGSELCDFFEEDLRRDGPVVIHIESKAHSPMLAALLRSRGYLTMGEGLSKRFA